VTTGSTEDDVTPLLVVDAANVVGSRPDGWWRDRAGAAGRLLASLGSGLAGVYDVVVVLEGAARGAAEVGMVTGEQPVRVVHADGSGDDTIVAVVAESAGADPARPIIVVTADRGLRARVEAQTAQTRGPGWLWDQVTDQ
jgi:hypothetical protein